MGRSPCCSKEGVNRGAWTALEDKILTAYIKAHGEGKWRNLPKRAGLKRCGKSCRLRWLNYLRPDIKRGNISHDEEELIIRLHNLLGNRWSLIAGRLPGRTDNEIKNYWNTTLRKKVQAQQPSSSPIKRRLMIQSKETKPLISHQSAPSPNGTRSHIVHTKASRCTKVIVPTPHKPNPSLNTNQKKPMGSTIDNSVDFQAHQNHLVTPRDFDNLMMDLGTVDLGVPHSQETNFLCLSSDDFQVGNNATGDHDNNLSDHPLLFDQSMLENWMANDCLEGNDPLDLGTLASFLDSHDWP